MSFMSTSIYLYFNLSINPKLTMPLCLVSDSSMFPKSINSYSGPKSPMSGAWSLEFIINPFENLLALDFQSPLDLFNTSSNFIKFDVILEISEVILEIPLESIDF